MIAAMMPNSDNADYGEEIMALLEDLDASIADFDNRFERRQHEEVHVPGRPTQICDYPEIDPNAVIRNVASLSAQPVVAPTQPTRDADDHPTGDLLSEIRDAAKSQGDKRKRSDATDAAQRLRLSEALRKAFDYFHELTQHLNQLKPSLPCEYSLGHGAAFTQVAWHRGDAHAKTPSNNEFGVIESVVVRATFCTASDLVIVCPRRKAPTIRHELALLNVHVTDEDEHSDNERTSFTLSREIRLQLHLAGCEFTGQLLIHARNAAGFGLAAYATDPEKLDRESLNALGALILGRQRRVPENMRPIPFSQGLRKTK